MIAATRENTAATPCRKVRKPPQTAHKSSGHADCSVDLHAAAETLEHDVRGHSLNRPHSLIALHLAMLVSLLAVLTTRSARADSPIRLQVDWTKLEAVIREGSSAVLPREGRTTGSRLGEDDPTERWLQMSPRLSLVARDWGATHLVAGTHAIPTDLLRLDRSSRMVVSRMLLGEGRVAPFAQMGLGQWRIDTSLLPGMPQDVELAMQLATGFELRLTRTWKVALEGDYTVLYREEHEPQMITSPWLWGGILATRATF
jgi:hypothetical protein